MARGRLNSRPSGILPDSFGRVVPSRANSLVPSFRLPAQAVGQRSGKWVLFDSRVSAGGQESTYISIMSTFVHHGLIFVPLGYAHAFQQLTNLSEVHGSSPWGAGSFAGTDGSRQPTSLELEIAEIQGTYIRGIVIDFTYLRTYIQARPSTPRSRGGYRKVLLPPRVGPRTFAPLDQSQPVLIFVTFCS